MPISLIINFDSKSKEVLKNFLENIKKKILILSFTSA